MPLIKADRVKETSTSTGTGTIALAGAATGYRAFSAVCAVGDTCYYAIAHQTAGEWEVGLATYSAANTLTRTTVHASSNSNAAVNFSAGTKDVFLSVTKAWLDAFLTTTSATTNYVPKTTGTGTIGDSQIYDNGTNVGIGTASPAERLHLYKSGDAIARIEGTTASIATFYKNSVYCGYIGAGSAGTNDLFIYNLASAAVRINNKAVYVTSSDTVGINETSPGAQLQVTTAAAATKGLIVKGAAAQSARYIELQDSTGTVIAGVNSAGMGEFNGVYSGENGKVQGFNGIELQAWNAGAMRSAAYVYKDLNMQIGGTITPNANIGSNQLLVVNSSPSWAALRIKGASGQSANLQEWQNNNSNALTVISSTGNIGVGTSSPDVNAAIHVKSQEIRIETAGVSDASRLRMINAAGGNWYVGAGSWDGGSNLQLVQGSASNGINITTAGNVGIGTTSPSDKLHVVGNVRAGNYTWGYLAMTGDLPGYANGSYPTLKSDNTIYFSADGKYTAYFGDASKNAFGLMHPTNVTTNVLLLPNGVSYFIGGAVAFGATTAAGGGQVYVAPQAAATKGLVVRGASGQSANLQEWQNNSGTALASVTSSGDFNAGNLNVGSVYCSNLYSGSSTYTKSIYPNGTGGFFSREFCLLRTLPDTVGDYVELFEYAHTIGHNFKISIGAVDYPYWDTATYEHAAVWDSSSYAIPPKLRYHRGTSDFVLEKVHGQTGPYTSRFRVKRTGTRTNTGSSTILVIRVEAWLSSNFGQEPITMMSGTGTSSITGYVANSEYCNPSLYPPSPLGWSGNGTDLSLYGANASGTGNGGSILLQAGAYATSGSNGKVIVRGLASNTANLQEWQNNAGTALTTIDSAGRIGAETAPDSNYSVKAAGRIYAGNDIITAAGLVTRVNAYDFTFGYGGPYIRRGFGGNGSTLYFGEDAAYQAAFEFFLGVAMPTVGVMRVTASAANTKALIVKAAASQTANLQEWQNSSGTALASVDASGNINAQAITNFGRLDTYFNSWYGSINRRVYRVTVPSTIGNYQEIFKLNWHSNTIAKIKVYAFGSGIYNAKEYDFNSTYGSEGVLLPSRSAYLYNTISVQYELESKWDPATGYNTIRVKRTAGTDALSLLVYVEVLDATSGHPVAASETGTSSIGGILGSYSSFNSIAPPDVVGGNGSGYNLNLYGGAGLGTGNGGNIILQAGAYSTSGSNGKVIVRGLASNTANLQEWQNNAGTALTTIDSAGRIGVGTAPQAGYSLYGTGSIYAGGGGVLVAGNAGLFYLNGRVGIGTGTGTPVFGCEYTNYMRPIILSGYPDGAGYIGTIINTSNTYANATAKLLSVQNNGTEKFSISSNGSITVGEPGESAGGPFTVAVAASGSNTVATKGQRHGRNLIIRAGDSDNYAGVSGGDTYIRAGAPVSPATTYGTIYIGDTGGYTSISGMVQPSSTPAALTADQNNLVLSASGFQRLSGTAARTITGIAPPSGASHVDGRMMRIYNVGSYNITLKHNSTSSSIANRFCCVQAIDIVLGPRDFAELIYDGTDGGLVSGQNNPCWRVA